MRLAKEGSEEAFGLLYDLYFVPVYRYIYFRVKNRQEAEDLTQAVFVKAFENVGGFEERGRAPLAYFFTAARNTVINYWRKKKEESLDALREVQGDTFPATSGDPREAAERSETGNMLRQALKNLTEEQQEVITMRFISELSNKEIAELLGKSEDAIRQLQSRGLRELRKYLKI